MVVEQKNKPLYSWWFDSHKNQRYSPWLSSAISDLEEKTEKILKLIEEDADSFAQRAEMYYKKRPELINMIEVLYRSHRSLAEQYDQVKFEGRLHRTTSFNSAFSERSWSVKLRDESSKSSGSSSVTDDESVESEVDDPGEDNEEEEETQLKADNEKRKAENERLKVELLQKDEEKREAIRQLCLSMNLVREENECLKNYIKQSKVDNEKLKAENERLKVELLQKDEEKREAIRQLCLSMNLVREENECLKNYIKQSKKWSFFDFKKIKKGLLSGKLFGGDH